MRLLHMVPDSANRILFRQRVVDAYGHVSTRHPLIPDAFLIASGKAPALFQPSISSHWTSMAGRSVEFLSRSILLGPRSVV
jgi:hypothetical protein